MATAPGRLRHSLKSSIVVVMPTENIRSPNKPVKYSDFTQVKEAGCFKAATAAIANQIAKRLQNVVLNFLKVLSSSPSSPALRKMLRPCLFRARAAFAKPNKAAKGGTKVARCWIPSPWAAAAVTSATSTWLGAVKVWVICALPAKVPWETRGEVTTMKASLKIRASAAHKATRGNSSALLLVMATKRCFNRDLSLQQTEHKKQMVCCKEDTGIHLLYIRSAATMQGPTTVLAALSHPTHPNKSLLA